MIRRLLLLTPLVAALLSVAPTANAVSSSPAPCQVKSSLVQGDGRTLVQVVPKGSCPEVSLALWAAPSLKGDPISSQTLISAIYDGPLAELTYLTVTLPTCGFWQLDLAFGPVPTNLSTPYGKRLIADWHGGSDAPCVTPTPSDSPTPVPTTDSPSPTPVVTTEPPVTTTPAPVPSSAPPVTTPPVVVVTTQSTTPPSPKPKPTPTNPGGGFGCVGTGCPTTPAPHSSRPPSTHPPVPTTTPPTLPYTGSSTLPLLLAGLVALVLGGGLLAGLKFSR